MRHYDYRDAVLSDLTDWINDNIDYIPTDRHEALEYIAENAHESDAVTGNGSGSYTFSSHDAEEYLCHNYDLAKEALEEYGCDAREYIDNAEAIDVIIRCYLLQEVAEDALDNSLWEEGPRYNVHLWGGNDYCEGNTYVVVAECPEDALDKAVARAVNNLDTDVYMTVGEYLREYPDEESDEWYYIDATMKGASEPVYIRTQHLRITAA